ncbi:ATP-dependent Clp protease ATP-binding subunit [Streptomyces sp. NPDC015661]|uniref:ATP-dependent Clp protease ATP-binding subunit n=1 Tax=Streptomyces sp. NPDC015661 TaxID=3364961 RepID=UPI00370286B5
MFPREELKADYTRRALEALDRAWSSGPSGPGPSGPAGTGPAQVLAAVLDQQATIVGPVLADLGVDPVDLRASLRVDPEDFRGPLGDFAGERPTADAETARPQPGLLSLLRAAEHEARQLGDAFVSVEHLVVALADRRDPVGELMRTMGADRTAVLDAVRRVRGPWQVLDAEPERTCLDVRWRPARVSSQVLRFGRDLTELAFRGTLDAVVGRDTEIARVVQVLSRRRKNNPVLIGDPGVGKTAIAEGLAQRIVSGEVPGALQNRRVIALDVGALIAGASYRGEFEDRVKAVLKDVDAADGGIILFIDELHTIIGAGAAEGAVDAGNLLKPMLARGSLRTLGATTRDEYRKYVESDGALERRFQPVHVEEPTTDNAVEMLRGLRPSYEGYHDVLITDAALAAAVSLSKRYIADRYLPDKAIDLIDEAASQRRIELDSGSRWPDAGESAIVDEEDVARVVAQWTGIPVSRVREEELEKLLRMEARLGARVVGQRDAIAGVSAALRNARAGLGDPNRPIAALLFCGPVGVGKTHLAHALAEFMFDSDDALIQLDMSEYAEKQSVTRLIGAPPGYVGYEEGGQLTEAVRRRPYAVVLLDDIEQAHPDIHGLLRQVVDHGSLTDGQGRLVSFRNVVLVMTSGLADPDAVRQQFRADFVTRLDDVVEFATLGRRELEQLVDLHVGVVAAHLSGQGISLELTRQARELVSELGDGNDGARPLLRAIRKQLVSAVSYEILRGGAGSGDTIRFDRDGSSLRLAVVRGAAEDEARAAGPGSWPSSSTVPTGSTD